MAPDYIRCKDEKTFYTSLSRIIRAKVKDSLERARQKREAEAEAAAVRRQQEADAAAAEETEKIKRLRQDTVILPFNEWKALAKITHDTTFFLENCIRENSVEAAKVYSAVIKTLQDNHPGMARDIAAADAMADIDLKEIILTSREPALVDSKDAGYFSAVPFDGTADPNGFSVGADRVVEGLPRRVATEKKRPLTDKNENSWEANKRVRR